MRLTKDQLREVVFVTSVAYGEKLPYTQTAEWARTEALERWLKEHPDVR